MTVLPPDELARCYELGKQRNSNHANIGNLTDTSESVHITGLKGEVAFAERYGLSVDAEDRPEGDQYDFRVLWGNLPVTIDVKTTQYVSDPWLKVRPNKVKADLYVLATVDGPEVNLIGYASDVQITATEPTTKTGHGANHVLSRDELNELPAPDRVTPL